MRKLIRQATITCCAVAALAWAACGRAPEAWSPVLEETSTAFLKTETEAVAARVRSAISHLPADRQAAAADLAEAEKGLGHLLTYYLPLLDARERAYNAYRHYSLGKTEETSRELDEVEKILMSVAASGHGQLLREVEDPLEKLEDAKAAVLAGTDEAGATLEALATRLNFLLVRGGLVLTE